MAPTLGWTIVPLAGAVTADAAGVVQWRRARALEDTPASRIRSASQGYVEFSGHARALPGEPVVSPLTGRRCVWWQYRVEQRRTVGLGIVDEVTDDLGLHWHTWKRAINIGNPEKPLNKYACF